MVGNRVYIRQVLTDIIATVFGAVKKGRMGMFKAVATNIPGEEAS